MSQPKTEKPSTPESLTKTGQGARVELSETELNTVSGGVRKDKMTSANKQSEAVKGLL
jgi:bacteriocin-like protein